MLKSTYETYQRSGMKLFPIRAGSKKPAITDNLNRATLNVATLKKWKIQFPKSNWGISLAASGYVCVDIDTKHGGLDYWNELIDLFGEPDTLKQFSGNGGLHYIFQDEDRHFKGKIRDGVDVKHNGYIVAFPSFHPETGKQYIWQEEHFTPRLIKKMPTWLLKLCEKPEILDNVSTEPVVKHSHQYLKKCVDMLKEKEFSYEEWIQVGMALHSDSPDDKGLELFTFFTENKSYKNGDVKQAKEKWKTFDANKSKGISSRTLSFIIRKKGLFPPNAQTEQDMIVFDKAAEVQGGFKQTKDGHGYTCTNKDAVVEFFDAKGYCVIEDSGADRNIAQVVRGNGCKKVNFLTPASFESVNKPYRFVREKETANGMVVESKPAVSIWLESSKKSAYPQIVFNPTKGFKTRNLNLFTKIPCLPVSGEPASILDFLHMSLCNEQDKAVDWLLDWTAHIVQHPHYKATTVPVLIGRQGTGKGLLIEHIFQKMFGDLYALVTGSEQILARFNFNLAGKLLTAIDESTWRGNKSEDNRLKQLVGSNLGSFEKKFGARITLENYSRYIIASNNMEAVAIERSNRRYYVIESSTKLANNTAFFSPIARDIRSGDVVEKFYNFLLKRDIRHFDPHAIPKTNAASLAKISTGGPVAEFWHDTFCENPKRLWCEKGLDTVRCFNEFQMFCKNVNVYQKGITRQKFWSVSESLMALPERTRKRIEGNRTFFYPVAPSKLRESFCESMSIEMRLDGIMDHEYYFMRDDLAGVLGEL